MKVLCFGSLNIDYRYRVDHFVHKGETISAEELKVFTGGKGLNQSIALAKAGVDTYHAGMIGRDGSFLIEEMEKAGVHTELVRIVDDSRTGNAIIQNDKEGDNCIILYGGANHSITKEYVDSVYEHFEKGDFLLLQNEINNLHYIMEKAYEKEMKICLNPSPVEKKIMDLPLQYLSYLILNEIEAAALSGEEKTDKEGLIYKLSEMFGNTALILTVGEEGSLFFEHNKIYRQESMKVNVVDTTAAGDTFTGFLLGGIVEGMSIEESMEQAAAASAIAVSRNGAAPSIPGLEEVRAFLANKSHL